MKKKMKVVLAANMYPSKRFTHYGVFVKNTEMMLKKMDNVSIKRVVLKKKNGKVLRALSYATLYMRLIFVSCIGRNDVVYGHFLSHLAIPIFIIRLFNKRIKIIMNVHGNDVVPDQKKDEKWIPLVRNVIPCIDEFIVPSAYFKKVLIEEYAIQERNITIFPSGGVNTEVFFVKDRESLCELYGLDSTKKYIGYVSRIEKNKGWDTFLNMAALLKDYENLMFLVIGDGDEIKQYEHMVKALDLTESIIKYDLLSQSEIADLFNMMDVFCFPTYRKSDSLGLVGIEAMACGTMVITSDQYGPSTYTIHGVNGFTFLAEDSQALSNCVKHVLELSSLEKECIRKQALETVTRFDKTKITSDLMDIFEKWR